MAMFRRIAILAAVALSAAACSAAIEKPLVDPVGFALPLVEAGPLEIDGQVAGQPLARDGIVYCATRDGWLTAVVVRSRSVLWRFRAGQTLSRGPELGDGRLILVDDSNTLHVINSQGVPILAQTIEAKVVTASREQGGRVFFATEGGCIMALDIASGGTPAWVFRDPSSDAAVTAGPVFAGGLVLFGRSDGRLLAFKTSGELVWQRRIGGAINSDPLFDRGRVFVGTEDRIFSSLKASNGRKIWSRRLQGAPLGPAVASGRRLALAASNSVVYLLARRGGSIVSWAAVPSRIIHEPVAARPALLISSAEPGLLALDGETGEMLGRYAATGSQPAGPLWVSPFVVLFDEDAESGRQRMIVLETRPLATMDRTPALGVS